MKKTAVMIYRAFCMQEISCLTDWLVGLGKPMIVCAADHQPVETEEGFTVLPEFSYDEVNLDEIDCLILPGISEFPEVLKDQRQLDFLARFKERPDILIASISVSPVLLAAAGLLEGICYCGGFYQEVLDDPPFMEKENFRFEPIVVEGNIMTAFGGAFREFALAVMEKLGFEVPAEPFGPLAENWTRDKLNFAMESEVEKTYWKNALAMLKRECPQFFENRG